MIVLALLAFVSAVLVALAVGLFAWTVRERTFDHGDHLSLLPLRGDAAPSRDGSPRAANAQRTEPSASESRLETVGTEHGFEVGQS